MSHTQAQKEKSSAALSSVVAAVGLTSFKVIVGVLTNFLGILAEAAHSALDLVAALMTFFAVCVSDKPPDREHNFGHGKVENLSALFETVLLLITSAWIIYEATQRLFYENAEVEVSIWSFSVMGTSIIMDYTRAVRICPSGARWFVDLHVTMDGNITLNTSHDITEKIENEVQKILPQSDVTVHVEPLETAQAPKYRYALETQNSENVLLGFF